MNKAFINCIGTAVPPYDIHAAYRDFMAKALDARQRAVFKRMADRAAIVQRYSVLPQDGMVEADEAREGFYRRGAYPGTATRMNAYARHAPGLALQAVEALGRPVKDATHLIVASCTGFIAPGLDQILAQKLGLRPDLQRLFVGFMGCCAAVPALRAAQAIVLADPAARVLVVNVELCTLHLQETTQLDTALSFLLFGDGALLGLVMRLREGALFSLGTADRAQRHENERDRHRDAIDEMTAHGEQPALAQRCRVVGVERHGNYREFPVSGLDEGVSQVAREYFIAIDRLEQCVPVDRVMCLRFNARRCVLDNGGGFLDRECQSRRARVR